jgi:hypothetical protein
LDWSYRELVIFVLRRIEDHGFLADLYFAVPEVAGALIDVQDGTGRGHLCVDQSEAARDRAFAEQALAGTDDHGELPDAQRIDEIVLEQGLEEIAAAVDLNLAARLFVFATSSATSPLSRIELLHLTSSSVREATNFGRVLRAVAISSVGSVELGQEPAKISSVLRPRRKAPARLVHSVMISPIFSSK